MSSVASEEKVSIVIFCDEAASLFKGGEYHPRFGGAGVHMHALAGELIKVPNYEVTFCFLNRSIKGMDGEGIQLYSVPDDLVQKSKFWQLKQNIKRLILRLAGKETVNNAVIVRRDFYATLPKSRIFITTQASQAVSLRCEAQMGNAKTIFQTASEFDSGGGQIMPDDKRAAILAAYETFDCIAVQTEEQKTSFARQGLDSRVVRKGLELPDKLPTANKSGLLWVGSTNPIKQPWVFWMLAKHFPEQVFTMLAPKAEPGLWELSKLASYGLSNLNLISEQIDYEDAQKLFDEAKICIYSTKYCTDPAITVLQAAGGGAATISYAVDSDGEMFTKKNTGLFSGSNFEMLIEQTALLLENDELRGDLAKNAFEYAHKYYSLEKMSQEYQAIIADLCCEKIDGR